MRVYDRNFGSASYRDEGPFVNASVRPMAANIRRMMAVRTRGAAILPNKVTHEVGVAHCNNTRSSWKELARLSAALVDANPRA